MSRHDIKYSVARILTQKSCRFIPKNREELLHLQRQVDEILGVIMVRNEFKKIFSAAPQVRAGYITKDAGKPALRSILEYRCAVYDFGKRCIYEGEWYETHSAVTRRNMSPPRKIREGINPFISGDVFCLRALPQIRIIVLDSTAGLWGNDLVAMQNAGYIVMGVTLVIVVMAGLSPLLTLTPIKKFPPVFLETLI